MSFNLAVILSETVHAVPDKPVAVFDGGRLSYRQLDQASDRVAANLAAAGLARGAVELREPELVAWCRKRLAAYKCPRIFQFRSELPKNALGKVLKDELARAGALS